MSKFNMSSTVKSIFAGDRASDRLQAQLFTGSIIPNQEAVDSLVDTLNIEHANNEQKRAAINMKCNRMTHNVAKDLELEKGKYQALSIKLTDDGVYFAELVDTRATVKDPLMEAAKAFKKSHSQSDMDKLVKAALKLLETPTK